MVVHHQVISSIIMFINFPLPLTVKNHFFNEFPGGSLLCSLVV